MPEFDSLVFFFLAGFLLKLADYWGEDSPRAIIGYVTAASSATFFWVLISADSSFSTVMIAIVVGNVFARKVDRPNLFIGLGILIGLSIGLGFELPIFVVLIPLAFAAYVDELLQAPRRSRRLRLVARYRPALKVAVVSAVIFGDFDPVAAFGLLVFDVAYEMANLAAKSIPKRKQIVVGF